MKTVDYSSMIVGYNFVIGVLIMLSSQKVGTYAGLVGTAHKDRLVRLTTVSTFTFGAVVAALSAGIYLAFHVMRIGV